MATVDAIRGVSVATENSIMLSRQRLPPVPVLTVCLNKEIFRVGWFHRAGWEADDRQGNEACLGIRVGALVTPYESCC